MNNSEKLKKAIDTFGRLSFMLESYVKLAQTADHAEARVIMLDCARHDVDQLKADLDAVYLVEHPESVNGSEVDNG